VPTGRSGATRLNSELNGKPFRVTSGSANTAGASFSSARLIVTARTIVVRSGTSPPARQGTNAMIIIIILNLLGISGSQTHAAHYRHVTSHMPAWCLVALSRQRQPRPSRPALDSRDCESASSLRAASQSVRPSPDSAAQPQVSMRECGSSSAVTTQLTVSMRECASGPQQAQRTLNERLDMALALGNGIPPRSLSRALL
jgi:hypothetical protein